MATGDKNNKELQNKYKRINPSCIIRTLVKLMQDPMSADQIVRQKLLLDDLILGSPCGFWVHDLSYTTELIEIINARINNISSFEPYLQSLLELCAFPPILMNFCSLTELQKDIVEYYSFFGYLLVKITDSNHRQLIFKAIKNNIQRKICVSPRIIAVRTMNEAIENSKLTEIVCNLMEISDDDFYVDLLKLANIVAKISSKICDTMLIHDTLFTVIMKLDCNWKENLGRGECPIYKQYNLADVKNFDLSLELIALLLKSYQEADGEVKILIKSPPIEALWALKYILRVLVSENRKTDRNYFYSILLLFFDCFPEAQILQSGLLKDVTLLGVATEIGTGGTWAGMVTFSVDEDDYQFKRLALLGIYYASTFFAGEAYFEENKIVNGLLSMIGPQNHLNYSTERFQHIQQDALNVIERLIFHFYVEFLSKNGLPKLIGILKSQTTHTVMVACLKCVNKLLLIKEKILDLAQIEELRTILKCLVRSALTNHNLNTEMQSALSYMFSILLLLINKTDSNLNDDIDICMEYINRALNLKEYDTRYDHKLMICVLSHLWKSIKNSQAEFQYFVNMKGIYSLLNIIKEAILPVQNVALGLLVDVCEEPVAIPYLVTWCNNKMSLLNLLLKIFREENKFIGVETTGRGVIVDILNPIMGKEQKNITVSNELSPAITDMDSSCRPKIYAIIQLLKVRHKEIFEIANNYYKIFEQNLSIDDKITNLLSENYLAFKIGETWRELNDGLTKIDLEPIYYDRELLDSVINYYEKICRDVQNLQNAWLSIEYDDEQYSEERYYNLLRESKLPSALKALESLSLIARTADVQFRNCAVTTMDKICNDMHTTINTDCKVSTRTKQKIILQSDVIIEPVEIVVPSLVSCITIDEVCIDDVFLKSSKSSINIEQECHFKKPIKAKKVKK